MGCSSSDLSRPRDVLADITREIISIQIEVYQLNIAITKDMGSERGRFTEKIRQCTNRLTYITSQLADIGRQNKLGDIQSKIVHTQNTLLAMRRQLALGLDMAGNIQNRQNTVNMHTNLHNQSVIIPASQAFTGRPKPLIKVPVEVPVDVQTIGRSEGASLALPSRMHRAPSEESALSLSITSNLSVNDESSHLNAAPCHTRSAIIVETSLDYPQSVRYEIIVTIEKNDEQHNPIGAGGVNLEGADDDKRTQDNSQYDPTPR